MRKSVKLFSMAVMSILMSLCFFFAGSALIKAEETNSLVVLDGASVYVSNNANESGIKFDVEILKTDYQTLVENNAGSDIYLGVEVIRATSGSVLGAYDVNTDGVLRTSKENANNYAYNFAIIFNEESYIEGLISSGKIEDTDAAIADAINKMYTDELAVKPYYKVVPAEGEPTVVYGAIGDSRSMIHVANAEVVAGADLPANFASTYIAEQLVGGEVEVDALGRITGEDLLAEIETFTMGTSAHVVAREDAVLSRNLIEDLDINDEFALYGFTADRKVYSYTAKYVGAAGMEAVAFAEEVLISKDAGKVFLNDTSLSGEEVLDVFYNDASIFVDGAVDVSALSAIDVATAFDLEILTNSGKYALSNAKLYDKVWENTEASRRDMAYFLSSYEGATTQKDVATLDGYYALAEDLVFANVELNSTYTFKETFHNQKAHANTFIGTFDGRGYTMSNFGLYGNGGIFGLIGSNATIKNVAFVNPLPYIGGSFGFSVFKQQYEFAMVLLFNSTTANTGLTNINISDIYIEINTGYKGNEKIFVVSDMNNVISGDNQVTFNNFIVNRNYFESEGVPVTWIDENGDGKHDNVTISNPLWDNWIPEAFGANANVENSYILTMGRTNGGSGVHLAKFNRYVDYAAFENASSGLDLTSFNNDNWKFNVKGAPVWNTLAEVPQLFDAEGNEVSDIAYGADGATDSIYFTAGIWTSDGIENAVITTNDAENIVINGNSIEVKAGKYSATITVANADGSISKTYEVTVDTTAPTDFNEQVLYSKAANKVYLNRTSLEEATILAVAEYDFSQVVTGSSISGLVIYTDNAKYNLTNVLVCEDAYANTHEDRVRFVNTFTAASKTISGYYALVENITFEHVEEDGRMYDTSEVFMGNTVYQRDTFNTFAGTFDGRGFAFTGLKVKIYHYAIFGNPTDGAVLKNFAINGITVYNVHNDYKKQCDFHGILFATYTNVADEILMENIYVEYDVVGGGSSTRNGALFANKTNVEFMAATTFRNVIVKATAYTAEGTLAADGTSQVAPIDATANPGISNGIIDSTHIENSHIITNGRWTGGLSRSWFYEGRKWNSRNEIFGNYGSYEEFVADKANIGVETFSDTCWVINPDGVPAWKSLAEIPQITDAQGASVKEIVYEVEGATDSLFFSAGIWTAEGILEANVSCDNENVVIDGNSIEVKPGEYSATITVANLAGTASKNFVVSVNTNLPAEFNEEVLLEKATGKLFFQGTALEGTSLTIDMARVDENQAMATQFALGTIIIGEEKYNLTNVKMYDKVWENTEESRQDMAAFFSTYTGAGAQGPKELKTLDGYYALAEDLVFVNVASEEAQEYTFKETFYSEPSHANTFAGTFDGRGFAMYNSGAYGKGGMFGILTTNATIKNVAIINPLTYAGGDSPSGFGIKGHKYGVSSVILFHGAAANTGLTNINISDVYVEYTTAHTSNETVFVINKVEDLLTAENQVSINNFIVNRLYIEEDYTPTTWVDENADGRHDVVGNALFNEWAPTRTLGANVSVTNTYMLTFGRTCGAGGWHMDNFVWYNSYETFAAAASSLNLTSFANGNWTMAEGSAPTWASLAD